MSESFSVSLRPKIEKRDRPDSLPRDIAQINAQWGSFRELNEATLRQKIEADKHKDPWEEEDEGDKESADLETSERLDQLYKRRAEIIQFALQAHMEASFALDFVSLLMSKHQPRQAETSMSPFLKSAAPLGSLNAEVVNPPPRPDSTLKDIKSVSRGWRLQNFNSAASKLLNAGSRLETEVNSETKYWNEVLAVKEKGWKVCRLPREGQALGVQYGFLEATPLFRDRGLAALRRTDDGSLFLDKGLIPLKAQGVRVRMKHGDRIVGCSKVCRPPQDAESIESRILQARDTVFEEELFYEIMREARILGSQGVTTRQNLVQIPLSEEQEVLLDLVDRDQDRDPEAAVSSERDVFADSIAHSIRILLTYAHRQNLRRRTQPPPPLAPKRRPIPEYQILRPIMAYLQHKSHIQWLESLMNDLRGVLKSAGIACDFRSTQFDSIGTLQPNSLVSKVEALARVFLAPIQSTFSATLVTPGSSFRVRIRTNPAVPPFGTFYDISVNLPQYPDVQPPSHVGLQEEVSAILTHVVMLDIAASVPLQGHGASEQQSKDRLSWEVAYAHHGELLALGQNGQSKKMKISLSRDELTIHTIALGRNGGMGPVDATSSTMSQTWKAGLAESKPTLSEFVAQASQP
ncbi:mediator of RNA polymerase II transcription subunit 17 [Aspergillus mulundensis]|uniref:Mediator of RNA polymerase II transcription subunit 17 n=1 Tax=Aspergillus mulundensis TaxID=1810919 RepID=A0A3D8SKX1_9EURO|nr:Mediator of RNA polymerase II transcription subunit 17 [Aspergillus mulundensis]RDW86979.1 Mediator of RNA polymerase II transcription subunit 17 [Aspergillus mulundensis]